MNSLRFFGLLMAFLVIFMMAAPRVEAGGGGYDDVCILLDDLKVKVGEIKVKLDCALVSLPGYCLLLDSLKVTIDSIKLSLACGLGK